MRFFLAESEQKVSGLEATGEKKLSVVPVPVVREAAAFISQRYFFTRLCVCVWGAGGGCDEL